MRRYLIETGPKVVHVAKWFAQRIYEHHANKLSFASKVSGVTGGETLAVILGCHDSGFVFDVVSPQAVEDMMYANDNWLCLGGWVEFSEWKYDMTLYVLDDGLIGDAVVYSDLGDAFFFTMNPDDGVRMTRAKRCCPECHATSKSCACLSFASA